MRIWIKFAKQDLMRYLSHLDLMRTWQRAVRRAALPLVYSRGFNPHPKLSFASALPVGVASAAEYADIYFAGELSAADMEKLQGALPAGLALLCWRSVPEGIPPLMSLVRAAAWSVPLPAGVRKTEARVEELLHAPFLPVRRKGKKGEKTVDIRPSVLQLAVDRPGRRLTMLLAAGADGGARPREVLELLALPGNGLQRDEILLAAGPYLQAPMAVLLKEKEVSLNAEKDYYQLRQ
ncbi:MAG: DUF2344 domain-containing protein [Firmicutes bacterium]|nr:DUF2344 domain-containing protein [Bacillota bacterium]